MTTTTRTRIARLETEAQRFAKLAQFEFSPIQAAFYRKRSQDTAALAAALQTADIGCAAGDHSGCEQWLLHVGRDADAWYGDRAAARMAGGFL